MTTASVLRRGCFGQRRRFWSAGFSLVEVVVATGLCTYALVIIACLLPMGLGTVQTANAQIVQTEIFNRIWLEVNTMPFYSLPTYQRFLNGRYPDNSTNPTGDSYFDKDGGEIGGTTAATSGAPGGTVYYVYCTLINSNATTGLPPNLNSSLLTRLGTLGPNVDGLGNSLSPATGAGTMGAGLTLVRIDIGFHIDPSTVTATTDTRVTSRSYLVAKRDTSNGS